MIALRDGRRSCPARFSTLPASQSKGRFSSRTGAGEGWGAVEMATRVLARVAGVSEATGDEAREVDDGVRVSALDALAYRIDDIVDPGKRVVPLHGEHVLDAVRGDDDPLGSPRRSLPIGRAPSRSGRRWRHGRT